MADIQIEVIYALPEKATCIELTVAEKTTIRVAIERSGILEQHSDIDLSQNKVGVYSQIKALDDELEDGDQIEIYRPLVIDPKEARRKRANK